MSITSLIVRDAHNRISFTAAELSFSKFTKGELSDGIMWSGVKVCVEGAFDYGIKVNKWYKWFTTSLSSQSLSSFEKSGE